MSDVDVDVDATVESDAGEAEESAVIKDVMKRLEDAESLNKTLRTQIEELTHRVQALESSDSGYEEKVEKKKSSKRKSGKKKVIEIKKKKLTKEQKKVKASKEKKISRGSKPRGRTKEDNYTFCGQTIYVDVPLPFKHGKKHKSPSSKLELEYAYGFNGTIPQNMCSLKNPAGEQELAYGLAGIGVIHNVVTGAQRHFRAHNEDVSCIASNNLQDSLLIATGQRDPKDSKDSSQENKPYVCIWDPVDCFEVGRVRNFAEREICSVDFSFDGKFLWVVGGDDSHTGGLFKIGDLKPEGKRIANRKDLKKPVASHMVSKADVFGQCHAPYKIDDRYVWITFGLKIMKWFSYSEDSKEEALCNSTPESYSKTKVSQTSYHCAAWSSNADHPFVLVGAHSGHIYVYNKKQKLQCFPKNTDKPVMAILRVNCEDESKADSFRVFDSKGRSSTWTLDVEENKAKLVKVDEHKGNVSVASAVITSDNDVYLGSTKGSIAKSNPDSDSKSGADEPIMFGHKKEIWCLAAHPTETWLVVGSNDGTLRIWDYESKKVLATRKEKKPITGDFSRDGKYLAIGATDGSVVVYDTSDWSAEPLYNKDISKEQISAIAFSQDGSKIIVGGWDQYIQILNKKGDTWKKKKKILKGHTSSITHICLTEDGKFAQSNSKDCEILYWDIAAMEQLFSVPNDLIWDRWNCILGWPVQGLFYEAGDPTDVNCCEVSGDNSIDDDGGRKMVASGDDSGMVSVFKYPILESKPKNVDTYYGHSAHVTNVRWAEDDSYLFTTGGGDLSVFQWRVCPKN